MTEIGAGITAVSHGMKVLAWLRQVDKNYDAAEFKLKISELADALYDAKDALRQANDRQSVDAAEIERLKSNFKRKGELVRGEGNYQYFSKPNGKPIGYPICPRCVELECRMVELKQSGYYNEAECPVCSKSYNPVTCYYSDGSEDGDSDEKARRKSSEQSAKIAELGLKINGS
ncbi:hypothetical protein GRI42_02385 [Erythrobacter gaetbuli]|uniref:Uncharacterized protein n=1 Tax=Qipengyuania gaetbuli TaxID=266952 RepID=A0A844XW89_9SPHN|nr:hypothetical protein [Qipengyuania gaetbuli]MXO50150.1 hypothetical protein [Qipengyuania gaetbuli]